MNEPGTSVDALFEDVDLGGSSPQHEAKVDVGVGGVRVAVAEADQSVGGGLGGGELDVAVAGENLLGGNGAPERPRWRETRK